MVKYSQRGLDDTFAALADPTRRAILARLQRGPAPMREVAQPFGMSWPAVTKHVKVLERAGLVKRAHHGREHHIHLSAAPMRQADMWLQDYRRFWEERFDALARYLIETSPAREPRRQE